VRVTFPLPGPGKARYDRAEIERAQALLETKRLEQMIIAEVRDRVRLVDVASRQVEAAETAMDKERQNFKAQEERYKAGQVSTHDMIDYLNRLWAAEFDTLRAKLDYMSSVAAAEKAEGTTLIKNQISIED
jgi:outer membrane protein TolC